MNGEWNTKVARREWLCASMLASGIWLVGFDRLRWLEPHFAADDDALRGGKKLGVVEFTGEGQPPMGVAFGEELDGRLFTDLSGLIPENSTTPTEKFYIRTRASELLDNRETWKIQTGGLVGQPVTLTQKELRGMTRPAGLHLMECAGNTRMESFGMMSVAEWAGVPVSEILDVVGLKSGASRVLISGFDSYRTKSLTSVPGASWVFTREEIESTGALLATEMNGCPLTKDHGAPVRLLVPGWYGCTCIKWVNKISLVEETIEATPQMQEYAKRTHQDGVPAFAKDFKPASIDQAAMPVRVEKWLVEGKTKYLVSGILWGGSRPVKRLEIQFNPEEDYVRVDNVLQTANDPWSFWRHLWTPTRPGTYLIRLRVKEPSVSTKRLDMGFYVRAVKITEV